VSTTLTQLKISGVTVAEAEQLWYDTARWPLFVDGLQSVVSVEGDPPQRGSRVVWQSFPAGRGEVSETVVEYSPGAGQQLEVLDRSLQGVQRVGFSQLDGAVGVELSLDYRLSSANPLRALIDLLFIRRAQNQSLRRTLAAFAAELQSIDG